jgi:Zn-dependent protease with chaperone function
MVIVSWRAHWFDGIRSTPFAVQVSFEGPVFRIRPDVGDESASRVLAEVPAEGLTVAERFLSAPRMIELPGGGSLQVEDDEAGTFDSMLRQAGYRPGPVYRLIDRWRNVLVCLALLIGVIVWMDRQGAGLIASFAIRFVPSSVDVRIGQSALALADAQWLAASRLPLTRRNALQDRFSRLVHEQYPGLAWQLEFRSTSESKDAFNAFALPGGTIVLLDGLVEAMDDEEVVAVLGHELGHVVHRDVMQGIARQMGLFAVAGVVWGQMSSVAASVAAGVQGLHFARDVETGADAFAVRFLRRGGIPVRRLADAFAVMQRQEETTGAVPTFLSDHPSTAERLRAAAAGPDRPVSGNSSAGKN